MRELDIDGYTLLYLLTFALWVLITLIIFAQRQIFRFRNNNMRREMNPAVGSGLSKSKRNELNKCIDAVCQFQLLRSPKFTEIGTISEHVNAPYIYRMIALDELREVERQLEFINSDLYRLPGESTYAYFIRLHQDNALPALSESTIERIGFLAEHARFRSQNFGEQELDELRAHITDIMRMLNNHQQEISAYRISEHLSGKQEANKHELASRQFSMGLREVKGLDYRQKRQRREMSRKRSHKMSGHDEAETPLLPVQRIS